MIPLKIATNNGFSEFQSGAGFRPSTVWQLVLQQEGEDSDLYKSNGRGVPNWKWQRGFQKESSLQTTILSALLESMIRFWDPVLLNYTVTIVCQPKRINCSNFRPSSRSIFSRDPERAMGQVLIPRSLALCTSESTISPTCPSQTDLCQRVIFIQPFVAGKHFARM